MSYIQQIETSEMSFQPPAKFGWIASAVEHSEHRKAIVFDREVNAIKLESFQANLARPATHLSHKFHRWNGATYDQMYTLPM